MTPTHYCTERIENREVYSRAFERYISKIAISSVSFYENTPCWKWTGSTHPVTGYGEFRIDGRRGTTIKKSSPHRYIYQYLIGEIPSGKEVDHLCHNRACSNPLHLQLLTHKDNIRRRKASPAVTGVCKNGHPMKGENIYTSPSGISRCRTCQDASVIRFHAKRPNYLKSTRALSTSRRPTHK